MLGKYVKNVYKKYFQPTTDPSPPIVLWLLNNCIRNVLRVRYSTI